ncbi:hypothetical protein IQ268_31160 [Oculatella sp. LEGE 06141]|uniref:hypothetical protein n=1 Tax=Oculatella sp. LEGE 06141 TaxID=1828648 RepID=UPI001881D798|nr:hypothetical protein [Oculatella sp. LEGE 06141]MBE9182997.1 hypothetical protein [Oculatella sp. LEGE 06141]
MKSSTSWLEYQRHRFNRSYQQPAAQPGITTSLNSVWNSLRAYLFTSSEPRIWTTVDSLGETQWHGYDPLTRQSVECTSETDMRIWLEQRHYEDEPAASQHLEQFKLKRLLGLA